MLSPARVILERLEWVCYGFLMWCGYIMIKVDWWEGKAGFVDGTGRGCFGYIPLLYFFFWFLSICGILSGLLQVGVYCAFLRFFFVIYDFSWMGVG